jgi:hypothetical protein
MVNDEQLTEILEALAKPVSRQFIELVALQPRTDLDLQKYFDLSLGQIQHTGRLLAALRLVLTKADPKHYDYDPEGLALVRDWITRIESIRGSVTGGVGT